MAQIIETPDRVVVVTGTPFSSGIRLLAFGALLGAGGMYYFLTKKQPEKKFRPGRALLVNPVKRKGQAALEAGQSKLEDVSDTVSDVASNVASNVSERAQDAGEDVSERAKQLFSHVKTLAGQAKELAQTTGEALKPTLQNAIEEGKRAASEVQSRLKEDVTKAGDRPALAEEDGELPSQRPDKHME